MGEGVKGDEWEEGGIGGISTLALSYYCWHMCTSSFIYPFASWRVFVRKFAKYKDGLYTPDWSTIHKRLVKMDVRLDVKFDPNGPISLVVDSSRIKVANYGDWMGERVRRSSLKIPQLLYNNPPPSRITLGKIRRIPLNPDKRTIAMLT